MARQPRRDAPGAAHHVWARGIDGRALFLEDGDRHDLLARLDRILPESGMRCFAWALMSNHLHLAVQTGPVPLSTVMKRLHTGFAIRFNRRQERCGYLFQGRFGSRVVADDGDLLAVIAYVLRNPLAAGVVRSVAALERYPWSGYGALSGRREPLRFESTSETLALFGPDRRAARERLREWIERARAAPEGPAPLDVLIRELCHAHAVAEAEVRGGRRTPGAIRVREAICRRAVFELGLRGPDVAEALGITRSAVSRALRRESVFASQRRRPSPPAT